MITPLNTPMTNLERRKQHYFEMFTDIFSEISDIDTSAEVMAEAMYEAIDTWITYHSDAVYRYELLHHKLSPICTRKHYDQEEQATEENSLDSDNYGGRRDRLPRRLDRPTGVESE